MTVLFCDLVGFTAASEAADPEDVRARIRPYHARLRQEIERYGGTVEKFIGDAVMAVFGAPVGARGRRRARRPGRAPHPGGDRGAERGTTRRSRCRCGSASTPARRSSRSAPGPKQGEGIVTGDVVNTASRLQGAAPVNGIAVLGADVSARRSASSTTRSSSRCTVKGKAEPLALYRPLRAARPLRLRRHPHAHDPARRPRAREAAPDRHVRALRAAALLPAGDDRRRAGRRQEPALRGALRLHRGPTRARPLAPGPLPALRRGDRLLGARGDREGGVRDPRVGLARGGRGEARARPPRGRPRPRLAQGAPGAARRRRRRACLPGGVVHGLAALPRVARRRGAETVLVFEDLHWADDALLSFLEHLADWSEGVPLLLALHGPPGAVRAAPALRADARNAQRINLAPLSDEETARLLVVAARAGRPAGRDAAGAARARRRQPPVRGGVRAPARRPRPALGQARGHPVPGLGAGADRRPTRHAPSGAEEPAPGRRRRRQASSGRARSPRWAVASRARSSWRCTSSRARSSSALRARARWRASTSTASGTCSCATSATRRSRAPPAPPATRQPPTGSSEGRRAGGGPRRRARPPLPDRRSSSPAPPAADESAELEAPRDPLPRARRRAGAPARRRERRGAAWPGRSSSRPPATHERALLLERWAQAAQQQGRLLEARDALEEALALVPRAGRDRRRRAGADGAERRAQHVWATLARTR